MRAPEPKEGLLLRVNVMQQRFALQSKQMFHSISCPCKTACILARAGRGDTGDFNVLTAWLMHMCAGAICRRERHSGGASSDAPGPASGHPRPHAAGAGRAHPRLLAAPARSTPLFRGCCCSPGGHVPGLHKHLTWAAAKLFESVSLTKQKLCTWAICPKEMRVSSRLVVWSERYVCVTQGI